MSTNENKYDKSTRGSQIVADYAAQITGKVVVITGGSPGGIGAFLADAIAAASPALIVIGVRDVAKGEATAAHLKTINPNVATRILEIDLASFTSVRKAAAEVNAYSEKIDVLINNAGVMALGAFTQTEDGHETQFQVNFLAPFLFTNLVADKLVQDKTRVVNVSSDGYRLSHVRFQDYGFHPPVPAASAAPFASRTSPLTSSSRALRILARVARLNHGSKEGGESYDPWKAYGQSKTALNLFTYLFAQKLGYRGVTAYSVHPGVAWTNLGRHVTDFATLVAADKSQGNAAGWVPFDVARFDSEATITTTVLYAAFAPELAPYNGRYLEYCKVIDEDDIFVWALGEREARKVWALSEKLVGQTFEY